MPKANLVNNRYTGICDNCGENNSMLTKHVLMTYEYPLRAGATVYDCPKCMMKYPVSEWPSKVYNRLPGQKTETEFYHAPDVHCAICHVKAPVKYTKVAKCPEPFVPGNILGLEKRGGYLGDITGWMLIEFPVVDRRHYSGPEGTGPKVQGFNEKTKVCPTCTKHITGTINHHKDGYHED